jgi:hypothetical protein
MSASFNSSGVIDLNKSLILLCASCASFTEPISNNLFAHTLIWSKGLAHSVIALDLATSSQDIA